jgi:hypothetical protein
VGCCECGDERSGSIKVANFLTSLVAVSFSRRTLLHGVIYLLRCELGL